MILLLFAQIEITAELSRDYVNRTLSIGDPFEIVVSAQYPADTKISGPFLDSLDPFLIIEQDSRSVPDNDWRRLKTLKSILTWINLILP